MNHSVSYSGRAVTHGQGHPACVYPKGHSWRPLLGGSHPWGKPDRLVRARVPPAERVPGPDPPRGGGKGAHTAWAASGTRQLPDPTDGPLGPWRARHPRRLHTKALCPLPTKERGFSASPPLRTLLFPAACPAHSWGWRVTTGTTLREDTGRDGGLPAPPHSGPSEPPSQPLSVRDGVPPVPSSWRWQAPPGGAPSTASPSRRPTTSAPPVFPDCSSPARPALYVSQTNFLPQLSPVHPHQHLKPRGRPHPDPSPQSPPGSQTPAHRTAWPGLLAPSPPATPAWDLGAAAASPHPVATHAPPGPACSPVCPH